MAESWAIQMINAWVLIALVVGIVCAVVVIKYWDGSAH